VSFFTLQCAEIFLNPIFIFCTGKAWADDAPKAELDAESVNLVALGMFVSKVKKSHIIVTHALGGRPCREHSPLFARPYVDVSNSY
jgi:hypothetical protein